MNHLRLVGLGVLRDLVARERGAGDVAARRIADQSRNVANQENDRVAKILKVLHLAKKHGVAKMQVGSGGVEAGLDAQRPAQFQALPQLFFADDLRKALAEVSQLLVDRKFSSRDDGH